MRLSAYKKMIDSALKLPKKIEGADYFKNIVIDINPRELAVNKVLKIARLDIDSLFHCEFLELYEYNKQRSNNDF